MGALVSEFNSDDFSSLISNEYIMNLSKLPVGIYFIQLNSDQGVHNFELILN
jgi:hypothetical protein